MKRLVVDHQGTEAVIHADRIGDTIWIHFDGETFSVPASTQKRRRGTGTHLGETAEGDVVAPMPGKITQVLVGAGDQVKKGQTLIVMEAMKMEYNLKSSFDGEVEKVNVKPGEQVALGLLLVHVKGES